MVVPGLLCVGEVVMIQVSKSHKLVDAMVMAGPTKSLRTNGDMEVWRLAVEYSHYAEKFAGIRGCG